MPATVLFNIIEKQIPLTKAGQQYRFNNKILRIQRGNESNSRSCGLNLVTSFPLFKKKIHVACNVMSNSIIKFCIKE